MLAEGGSYDIGFQEPSCRPLSHVVDAQRSDGDNDEVMVNRSDRDDEVL